MAKNQSQPEIINGKKIMTRPNGSKRVITLNTLPSKTDQSFKDDCDINTILKKFEKTGMITHRSKRQGIYTGDADVPTHLDLQTAHQMVQDSHNKFKELPAQVREKFNNNPLEMIQFLNDPKNLDESEKLGLIKKRAIAPQNDDKTTKQAQTSASDKKTTKKDESPKKPDPE